MPLCSQPPLRESCPETKDLKILFCLQVPFKKCWFVLRLFLSHIYLTKELNNFIECKIRSLDLRHYYLLQSSMTKPQDLISAVVIIKIIIKILLIIKTRDSMMCTKDHFISLQSVHRKTFPEDWHYLQYFLDIS